MTQFLWEMKNAVKILIIIIIIFFIKTFFKWIISQYLKDISYHFPIINLLYQKKQDQATCIKENFI